VSIPIPFRSVQRVYFDDLDALNILHNVRFLLFMERARGDKGGGRAVGPSGSAGATLGDVLKQKLGDKIDDLAKE